MALTSIATQAGATEEEARNFKYFETELKTKLATLSVIATELQALSADKNLTGKAAVARASQLHGKLTAATSDITSALEQLVAIHQSEVSAQDAGSTANLARTLANADEKNQHPLTQWVNQGVNENAEQIIASLSWVTQEYPFQPGRINEQPDPYMPPQFKPTIGQALTHAVHQAVKADNVEVLSALWQKLKFTQAAEYSPFLLELYQGAGYYRETGSIETLMPKPNVFGLITTPDYLGCLSTDALSQLLITLAGHTSTVTKELTQFLQSLPHNRKDKLDYTAALQAAACNETRTDIRSKKNVEILLPFAPQNARNETYKTIATMQPRLAHVGMKESQACIDMADTLLAVTTKPLSCDLLVAIAKTGSATNLRHALVHLEAKELPDVLAKTVSTPSIASEENTQILLQHVETSHITVEPDKLSAALDFAVLKGYIKLLGAIVDMPAVHPLLNAKETKAAHANEGGNRILYKAAIY